MSAFISEPEFMERVRDIVPREMRGYRCVTGPGRSGAIASVYVSHHCGLPWVPFGVPVPERMLPVLVVDTAQKSGRTLRRAVRAYGDACGLALFAEPPRLRFWYEGPEGVRALREGESDAR